METLNRFQAVDIILEYIDRPEHHNNMFDAETIQKELFPNDHVDTVQFLFELIEECGIKPPIAKVEIDMIYRTVHTKHFLDDGGFTKAHKESLTKAERQNEVENLELQKLRSENEKLVNELIEFPKIKAQRKWLFIIAIIELLAILIGLILQSKGKS